MRKNTNPPRAINQPENGVGQQRYQLYRAAYSRVKEAMEGGFYLEAITLIESIIADRLEARKARLHDEDEAKRRFSTLGSLTSHLLKPDHGEPEQVCVLYTEVRQWANGRNKALHQMVKLAERSDETWEEKYEEARKAAEDGLKLARKVSDQVKKLNKPPRAASAKLGKKIPAKS